MILIDDFYFLKDRIMKHDFIGLFILLIQYFLLIFEIELYNNKNIYFKDLSK